MDIRSFLENLRTLLFFWKEISYKDKVCPKCGYPLQHRINFCSDECCKHYLSMKPKRQKKIIEKYLKNPFFCPFHPSRRVKIEGRAEGYLCQKCGSQNKY